MNDMKRRAPVYALIAILALVFLASLFVVSPNGAPVQAAIITPVVNDRGGPEAPRIAEYFASRVVTADTRICFDLAGYETLDLQYAVDATASNATTVTHQQTNISPTAGPFNSGSIIATVPATPADADAMSQVAVFGRWNCMFVDVTNASPVTITVIGVAK
jgi:hypothetical protein